MPQIKLKRFFAPDTWIEYTDKQGYVLLRFECVQLLGAALLPPLLGFVDVIPVLHLKSISCSLHGKRLSTSLFHRFEATAFKDWNPCRGGVRFEKDVPAHNPAPIQGGKCCRNIQVRALSITQKWTTHNLLSRTLPGSLPIATYGSF